jgi:hypothetical protein
VTPELATDIAADLIAGVFFKVDRGVLSGYSGVEVGGHASIRLMLPLRGLYETLLCIRAADLEDGQRSTQGE